MSLTSNRYLLMAGLTLLLIFGTAILKPWTTGLGEYSISKSRISVFPADINVLHDRYYPEREGVRTLGVLRYETPTEPHKFHFSFEESDLGDQSTALYIPSGDSTAYITVNGVPVSSEKRRSIYAPGLGPVSIFAEVPRNVMNPGHNRLHVHYMSDPHKAGLRSVFFGPRGELRLAYERQLVWEKTLPVIGLLLTGIMILMAFTGIYYSQNVGQYLCLAFILTLSGSQFLYSYLFDQPLFASFYGLAKILFPLTTLGVLYYFYRLQKNTDEKMSGLTQAVFFFALIGVLAGLIFQTRLSPGSPLFWANLILISSLPLALFWLISNIPGDLAQHKSRMSQLMEQVSEQAVQLDENSRLIAEQMKKSAIMEERQRFTRDIHDGIGGQLVSLLLRARRGKVEVPQMVSEIQSSVNDLRLIVDSMDHVGNDLESALLTLRARIERQLSAGRVQLFWEQSDNLEYNFQDPRHVLNLYRFIQEAVTNIVRHAEASEARVSILQGVTENDLKVEISDNGKGIEFSEPIQSGKGLRSLKERAGTLGGTFAMEPGVDRKGLIVILTL